MQAVGLNIIMPTTNAVPNILASKPASAPAIEPTVSNVSPQEFREQQSTLNFLSFLERNGFTDATSRGQTQVANEQTSARSQRRQARRNASTSKAQRKAAKQRVHRDTSNNIKTNSNNTANLDVRSSTCGDDQSFNTQQICNEQNHNHDCYQSTSWYRWSVGEYAQSKKYQSFWKCCDGKLKIHNVTLQQKIQENAANKATLGYLPQTFRDTIKAQRGNIVCKVGSEQIDYINAQKNMPSRVNLTTGEAIAGCGQILNSTEYKNCTDLKFKHCRTWFNAVKYFGNTSVCNAFKSFISEKNLTSIMSNVQCPTEPKLYWLAKFTPQTIVGLGASIGGVASASILAIIASATYLRKKITAICTNDHNDVDHEANNSLAEELEQLERAIPQEQNNPQIEGGGA